MSTKPDTVPQIITEMIRLMPNRKSFFARDSRGHWNGMTWLEFDAAIIRFENHFRARGLKKGDHLGLMAPTSLYWQIAEMAAWRCGMVVVAIDPLVSSNVLGQVIRTADLDTILVQSTELIERFLPFIRNKISWLELNQLASEAPRTTKTEKESIYPTDRALMIFTSGTTGQPKAICYSHAQLLAGSQAIGKAIPNSSDDVMLCWLPLAHLFQQITNLLGMASGMRIYFHEEPRTIMQALGEVRPTIFIGVPRFYEKVYENIHLKINSMPQRMKHWAKVAIRAVSKVNECRRKEVPCKRTQNLVAWLSDRLVVGNIRNVFGGRIRYLITGSAPMPKNMLKFYHNIGLCLLEAYGLSENTIPLAMNRPGQINFGSVGKPFDENVIRIGKDGEILVKGPGLFDGYSGKGAEDNFTSDGFYRSGDYGFMSKDGAIYLKGRKSDLIKIANGRQLAPTPIESHFRSSALIDQVVLLGHGKNYLSALIVPTEPGIQIRNLKTEVERLNNRLPHYQQIRSFKILDKPFSVHGGEYTSSLKLKRHAIAEKYRNEIEAMYPVPLAAEVPLLARVSIVRKISVVSDVI